MNIFKPFQTYICQKTRAATSRRSEQGNVLFLILIAVVLFAALSYAVTQSTRSGGGNANDEKSVLGGAQITQYPASVRTAIVRMIISNNVEVTDLAFNAAHEWTDVESDSEEGNAVFHPSGGGATLAQASSDVLNGGTGDWIFNAENEINLIGQSDGDGDETDDTVDVIAFLPDIKKSVCAKINEELGISSPIPTESGIDVTERMIYTSAASEARFNVNDGGTIGGTGATALNGQPFGCFQMPANTYYYYHVLVER